jgi:hypothetical protein
MAWSDAARQAALEARRLHKKAPAKGTKASLARTSMARSIRQSRNSMRSAGYRVIGLKGGAHGVDLGTQWKDGKWVRYRPSDNYSRLQKEARLQNTSRRMKDLPGFKKQFRE